MEGELSFCSGESYERIISLQYSTTITLDWCLQVNYSIIILLMSWAVIENKLWGSLGADENPNMQNQSSYNKTPASSEEQINNQMFYSKKQWNGLILSASFMLASISANQYGNVMPASADLKWEPSDSSVCMKSTCRILKSGGTFDP